jgi:ATP-dependent RNA helicase DDX49/DBP8
MEDIGMVINWDMPSGVTHSKFKRKDADGNSSSTAEDHHDERADEVGGAEEYVHRVGRTARMGKGGVAVSFITERREDAEMVQKIEKRIGGFYNCHNLFQGLILP